MKLSDSIRTGFIQLLKANNKIEQNRIYKEFLETPLSNIIEGAMRTLRLCEATIGLQNYQDITQGILLVLLTQFNDKDSVDRITGTMTNYVFILSKNHALQFLRHQKVRQRLADECQAANDYFLDDHRLIR